MKDTHLTLRLTRELARALTRVARARGVPKSMLVREAVANYVGITPPPGEPATNVPRVLTARELAADWASLPHLTPDEAADFANDVAESRARLPAIPAPWE